MRKLEGRHTAVCEWLKQHAAINSPSMLGPPPGCLLVIWSTSRRALVRMLPPAPSSLLLPSRRCGMRSSALDLGGDSLQASDPWTPQPLTISGAPIMAWFVSCPIFLL